MKLAVAFLERALHEGWSPDAEFGAHGVSTEMLIGAVQAPISEGGFDVGGLQLTREAHFYTSLVRTLRQAPDGELDNVLPPPGGRQGSSRHHMQDLPSLKVLKQGTTS